MHVMLDLETLSTRPDAAIISIGACAFDDNGISNPFHIVVDAQSNEKYGRHISASTVAWWMQQSEAARTIFASQERVGLPEALQSFAHYCSAFDIRGMWGNGSDFDNVVLKSAYEACGLKAPWRYDKSRCFRTLKNLIPEARMAQLWVKYAPPVQHNALDDAQCQAFIAVAICEELKLPL